MKCKCGKPKDGYKYCAECADKLHREHKAKWRKNNISYHKNYLKKWRKEFKLKYGYSY